MINFYKLEKVLKIWMESIKEKDEKWYKTTGFADKEDGWFQEYALSTGDTSSEKFKPRTAYIHCIKGMPSETQLFNICLDKKDNPVLVISSDGEVLWKCIEIDTGELSENFTGGNISKLRSMIIDADKTLEDCRKEHPKFDMDEDHNITITEVIFKELERIEIRFVANSRIFNRNNKLYVGFDATDEDGREWNYVFKVTEKHIPIRHGYSFALSGYPIAQPFQEYAYTAEFHGYYRPTEEEILNATFRWVVSDEVIKTANKEACYT
jgi:hypothetical protein